MRPRALLGLTWLGCTLLSACTAPWPAITTPGAVPTLPVAPIPPPPAGSPVVPTSPAMAPSPTPPLAAPTMTPAAPTAPPTRLTGVPAPPATATPIPAATAQPTGACDETQGRLSVAYLSSTVLGRRVAYSLYLPPCYDTDTGRIYPTLYLLHGANTDHTQWPDLNVAPDADRLIAQQAIAPLVVVMPDGDYRPGEDYAAFVLRDLLPHIEQTVRVAHEGSRRAIGGLSSGGWWALHIAFAHPDLFSAVGGHSPVTDAILTRQLAGLDVATAPRIYLDVGRDDSLVPEVRAFASALTARGLQPVVHVYPGAHNRPYWRAHTAEYLSFYAANWPAR